MSESIDILSSKLENINLEVENKIALVTMNRPKALNALNDKTLEELDEIFTCLAQEKDIWGVIITGEGKGFVAGADITELQAYGAEEVRVHAEIAQQIFNKIENLQKPVIAAVNGFAMGGGCELALSCDWRIASENAVFALPEVALGVIPCFGGTQRLPRLIGLGRAKELACTGRSVTAQEAYSMGLVNKVVPAEDLLSEAKAQMDVVMSRGPIAVRYAKLAVNISADADIKTGLEFEKDLVALVFNSRDRKEGVTAFLEKRPAIFENR